MKQNHTKHVYFSFFNPFKVTGELEIESLGCVCGGELDRGELDRGELAKGQNRYKPFKVLPINTRGLQYVKLACMQMYQMNVI